MTESPKTIVLTFIFFISLVSASAQSRLPAQPSPLDPTRDLSIQPQPARTPLPEQYIWTAGDVTVRRSDRGKFPWSRTELRTEPHFFRVHFNVTELPHNATVYVAGAREAHIFLNGQLLGDFETNVDAPINFRVFHANAMTALRIGDNVLAIEAIRGRGVVSGAGPIATHQLAYGEVMAAKLVPAAFGSEAPALVFTTPIWKSSATRTEHWSDPDFNDAAWAHAESLGPIESNVDFLQWSADAGMYGWPGYMGTSPWLHTYNLSPVNISHVSSGRGKFTNIKELTGGTGILGVFTVTNPQPSPTDAEAPSLLLDFGREVAGRLLVESASTTDSTISIAYGESELEALATGLTPTQRGGNYLGTNLLDVPANGTARGPKSAFRYVRIRFLRGAPVVAFKSIRLEGIYYPVEYKGSFESSDPLLNRIWETGAYTAHLCMQDGIWDAPKRDRGRWAGDLDIEGRVISTVFGDSFLLENTLRRLAEGTPPNQHVNGIPSYTALWITTLGELYSHSGDRSFLLSEHDTLLRLLARLDGDIDPATGLLKSSLKGWEFVDWAPGLYGGTPEAHIGTTLQYLRAYAAAPALLRAIGDERAALKYEAQGSRLRNAARKAFLSPQAQTVGSTWQLNTLAVLTGLPKSPEGTPTGALADSAIWNAVLSHVKQDAPTDQVISPYFNAYLIDAMAKAGHSRQALDWIRTYWGGMLAEGATSFWESYDLRWPKTDFHLSLQADGTSGFFVSLAHGWSSGPTAWLSENVLGIRPAAPGYSAVDIRPNLAGLDFAKGSVPTPHGIIRISIDRRAGISLDLPPGVETANVSLQLFAPKSGILVDGKIYGSPQRTPLETMQQGTTIVLTHSGHYTFTSARE